MFTIINIEQWNRRSAFEFFKHYDDPFFNITGPVDITEGYRRCKSEGRSFFLNSLYYATKAANEIEVFRYRLLDDQVVCYDMIHCGSAVLMPDNSFRYCYFDFLPDRVAFIREASSVIDREKEKPGLDPQHDAQDLLHFSVIPWISFTSFKHARRRVPGDTIPKIMFGKFYPQGDRLLLPFSVEVNHAMMDGYHVGLYFERFREIFNAG